MLIYVLVLFIIFTFILVPAYLILLGLGGNYSKFHFRHNYINTFKILKKFVLSSIIIREYFIFLFFISFIILFSNYGNIIDTIMEYQENLIHIFIFLIIGILFFINKVKIGFYFDDTENNKILYRQILFGNLKKVNGNITYKYFNKKNKIIVDIKFRDGSPKYIELKIDKILTIQITIQEIINDNFEANFIMIVDKKFTLMKGEGLFRFPSWLYGNYSDICSYTKRNFSKISCRLPEETYFFMGIYYNSRPFSDSSSIENCFKDSIINGKLERYYKSGKLYEKFIVDNENMYAKYESFYENGKLIFKGNRKIKEFEFHGICEHYYDNGKLKEKANYNYGYPLGLYESFYENGKLKEKRNLDTDGEGNFESFYENGKLKERGEYRNGYIKGDFESFYENGNLKEKGRVDQEYLNTKFEKIGNFECFHENGNLKERGNYKYPSKKDGLFEYYSQNGKLIKKENYKDGELI